MKRINYFKIALFLLFGLLFIQCSQNNPKQLKSLSETKGVAPTPPMGWNSFDAFGSTINESQFRAEVDFMKNHLLSYGWKYAVIDYIWFNSHPGNWNQPNARFGQPNIRLDKNGRPIDKLAMDKYGRLLPAINRFPSAADGKGFKPIADYVHSLGMKFGIHIMRGIPRQAYWDNTPIKETTYTARDIADTSSSDLCPWNNNMYGVDPNKPGAQAYYNSIVDLYAKWGVDFLKADDMSRPYHKGEIEMLHNAIEQCGKPMVLSLSPGEAPISEVKNLVKNANMWRISQDFWDNWNKLEHNFALLDEWSPYIQKNHWPDADMLPIGHISLNNRPHGPDRMSKFTTNETYTLLTLWSIARSPLIMGGDLLTTPQSVISFLQNEEVIAVDQYSMDNHQVFRNDNEVIWMAKDSITGCKYLAIFNLENKNQTIDFKFNLVPDLKGPYKMRDLWKKEDLGIFRDHFKTKLGPHGTGLFNMVAGGPNHMTTE